MPLVQIRCDLDCWLELNQLRAVPVTPKVQFIIFNKMSWSTVSKANDKSIKTSCETFCWSMFRRMSNWTLTRAVSVECSTLQTDMVAKEIDNPNEDKVG